MWEDEREGPEEVFTLATGILAVDGPTAVVRAEVCYGDPPRQEYRDLWIIRFAEDGHCTWFEEWPYWPGASPLRLRRYGLAGSCGVRICRCPRMTADPAGR